MLYIGIDVGVSDFECWKSYLSLKMRNGQPNPEIPKWISLLFTC